MCNPAAPPVGGNPAARGPSSSPSSPGPVASPATPPGYAQGMAWTTSPYYQGPTPQAPIGQPMGNGAGGAQPGASGFGPATPAAAPVTPPTTYHTQPLQVLPVGNNGQNRAPTYSPPPPAPGFSAGGPSPLETPTYQPPPQTGGGSPLERPYQTLPMQIPTGGGSPIEQPASGLRRPGMVLDQTPAGRVGSALMRRYKPLSY